MFDYKLLAALAAVIEQAGFERAAQVLGLSQSAVSQRIKLLEARVGAPVLVRAVPPSATEVGRRLLNHVQQVRLLERDLQHEVPGLNQGNTPERLRIAINADSLASWWAPAIADFCAQQGVVIDHVVEDQEVGLKRMRAGEVAACLCASERPMAGARSVALGGMRYLAVASTAFIERHFPLGVQAKKLPQVPALVFGPDDFLQHRYLASLGVEGGFLHHLCPSSEGFTRLVEAGLGWGMVPQLLIAPQLADGRLRELFAERAIDVPLYWHYWRNGGQLLTELTNTLTRAAAGHLIVA